MWLKKKSVLQADGHYNSNTAYDGTDWRIRNASQNWSASQTLPSVADAGKYFYLPALNKYFSGQLTYVGSYGNYWSSSANPTDRYSAYKLYFYSTTIFVHNDFRVSGHRVGGFE